MAYLRFCGAIVGRQHWLPFAVFVILASLDNAAAGVLPPLYAIIARDLQADETSLGLVTATYLIIVAAASVLWGFRGDQTRRKPLLFMGTLVWGLAMILTTTATHFWQFLLWQMITAVGVGAVTSLGFSVVSDVVPAQRRGLALSLWSVSQGLGAAFGAIMASLLGAFNWHWPFLLIAGLGFLFAVLFLFVKEPKRGQAEPELAPVFATGHTYQSRIVFADLPKILKQQTNRWLLAQSFFFSLAYGATIWIPRWAIARVQTEGFDLETATIIGNLFVAMFSIGGFFSIVAGDIGDRLQKRSLRGRPFLAGFSLVASIPFFVALFFIPFHNVTVPENGTLFQIVWAVGISLFTNGWVIAAFLVALFATSLQATDPPNWAAMLTDLNLPEHRGTMIGFSRLARAIGNAISVILAAWVFQWLIPYVNEPENFSFGLALFQILVIPAAFCYIGVARSIKKDRSAIQITLKYRAQETVSNPL